MKSVCLDLRQPLSLPDQRLSPSRAWFMHGGPSGPWRIVVGAVHIFLTGSAVPSVPSIIHGGLVTPVVSGSAAPSVPSIIHRGPVTPVVSDHWLYTRDRDREREAPGSTTVWITL